MSWIMLLVYVWKPGYTLNNPVWDDQRPIYIFSKLSITQFCLIFFMQITKISSSEIYVNVTDAYKNITCFIYYLWVSIYYLYCLTLKILYVYGSIHSARWMLIKQLLLLSHTRTLWCHPEWVCVLYMCVKTNACVGGKNTINTITINSVSILQCCTNNT